MLRTILLAGALPFVSAFLGGVLAFGLVVPPRPLRRRVLRGCISKRFTPSMAFAQSCQARLPVAPLRACCDDAADFA